MPPQREWFDTDYYAVLGVQSKASDKEITKAYRKLARKHHPDAADGNEDRFKQISAAYAVVGTPDKRKEYDEARRLGAAGHFAGNRGHASGPSSYTSTTYEGDIGDLGDFSSIFRNLFGRGGRGDPGGGNANFPMQGVDLQSRLSLDFENAVNGITTAIVLGEDPGTGAAGRRVNVRIPPGVNQGQRIRLPGKGGVGRNGAPNGDLYVLIDVKPHPVFGRKGANLTKTEAITYPQAVLGAELKVKTFAGGTVTLKIPAGTQPGATFRVKGKGVKSKSGTAGDLLVTTELAVPKNPSKAERELIEKLAEAGSGAGAGGGSGSGSDSGSGSGSSSNSSAKRTAGSRNASAKTKSSNSKTSSTKAKSASKSA